MKEQSYGNWMISFPLSLHVDCGNTLPKDRGDSCPIGNVLEHEYSPHPSSLIWRGGVVGVQGVDAGVSTTFRDSICKWSGATWLFGTWFYVLALK